MATPQKSSILAHTPFRLYTIGSFASTLGLQMQMAILAWEVHERTHSAWHLGLISLIQVLPVLVLIFLSGPLVDRGNPKRILFISQLLFGLVSIGFGLVSYFQAPLWAIYALVWVAGVARAFSAPSQSSLFPRVLPQNLLGSISPYVSLQSGSRQLAFALGPAVGSLLISIFPHLCWSYFLTAALEFLFPILLLYLHVEQTKISISKNSTLLSGLLEGFRYIWKTPILLSAISLDLFAVLLGGATTLLPVYAERILHVGSMGYGLLRTAPALGAVVMAIVLHKLPPFQQAGKSLLRSVSFFGITIIIFGISHWFWLSLLMLFLSGAFDHISVVIRGTLEQLQVPNELRGRVGSINRLFIDLSNQLGGFESGAVASLIGDIPSVVVGGIGTLFVVALVARFSPKLRNLHSLEEAIMK